MGGSALKSIEIVTHCWSGSEVPIYHRLLQIQLGSIARYAPSIFDKVKVTVCFNPEDIKTAEIAALYFENPESKRNVRISMKPLLKKHLFRRAIGRNLAAKKTKADVVWFTDCDYLFMGDCLRDAYEACLASQHNMVFPSTVHIHKAHSFGDVLIDKLERKPFHFPVIDREHFEPRKERKAIGGIQIVKGDWCREFGYLDGTKWVEPVDPSKGFRSCKGDVPFRQAVGRSEAVDISGVYRVRHSRAGRDKGQKDHGAKTRAD